MHQLLLPDLSAPDLQSRCLNFIQINCSLCVFTLLHFIIKVFYLAMKYNLKNQRITVEHTSASLLFCVRRFCPNSTPTPDSPAVSVENITGYNVASWNYPGSRTAVVRRSAKRVYSGEDFVSPYSGSFHQTFCQVAAPIYNEVTFFNYVRIYP